MLHFKKAEKYLKTAKRTKNLSVFQKIDLPLHLKSKRSLYIAKL